MATPLNFDHDPSTSARSTILLLQQRPGMCILFFSPLPRPAFIRKRYHTVVVRKAHAISPNLICSQLARLFSAIEGLPSRHCKTRTPQRHSLRGLAYLKTVVAPIALCCRLESATVYSCKREHSSISLRLPTYLCMSDDLSTAHSVSCTFLCLPWFLPFCLHTFPCFPVASHPSLFRAPIHRISSNLSSFGSSSLRSRYILCTGFHSEVPAPST
ncbi:hypothetical protein B0H19DRAFT_217349 [Mycena capillaripes]|nr:hypothetical protein B0H19DRAFT_217349 [Mycena capillaripes]